MIMQYHLSNDRWGYNLNNSIEKEKLIALAFDYVKGDISERSVQIFSRLLVPVKGSSIVDLGCGANGYYWALGYVQSVEQIIFVDRSSTYLSRLQKELEQLSRQSCETFDSTIDYLKSVNCISNKATARHLFKEILDKSKFVCFDFNANYFPFSNIDYFLALGSLGCVNSVTQLHELVDRIYGSLNSGGKLHSIWTPYKEKDVMAQSFIDQGIDGILNPGYQDFLEVFSESQFEKNRVFIEQIDYTNTPETGSYSNYSQPIFLVAQK